MGIRVFTGPDPRALFENKKMKRKGKKIYVYVCVRLQSYNNICIERYLFERVSIILPNELNTFKRNLLRGKPGANKQ